MNMTKAGTKEMSAAILFRDAKAGLPAGGKWSLKHLIFTQIRCGLSDCPLMFILKETRKQGSSLATGPRLSNLPETQKLLGRIPYGTSGP
ncbi:hypothetical protein [uncultured Tateyamaria sp.]|uniref:hypothetical protein n=1 Tax=uncultured Tateyamaria sp. TaxID=455651 RepID=UPI00260674C4|nr:hypothetical protein [uncultured Tateyamaria sp.]